MFPFLYTLPPSPRGLVRGSHVRYLCRECGVLSGVEPPGPGPGVEGPGTVGPVRDRGTPTVVTEEPIGSGSRHTSECGPEPGTKDVGVEPSGLPDGQGRSGTVQVHCGDCRRGERGPRRLPLVPLQPWVRVLHQDPVLCTPSVFPTHHSVKTLSPSGTDPRVPRSDDPLRSFCDDRGT